MKLLLHISALLVFLTASPSFARDMEAVPVGKVKAAQLDSRNGPQEGLVIVELFSSQACIFCPKADRLFAELIKRQDVTGIACHVDYFDVSEGALSRSFCTARQSWYMDRLAAGPHYTPQMIINGRRDVIGYKIDMVKQALEMAAADPVPLMPLKPQDTAGEFHLTLPENTGQAQVSRRLWMMLYDKPHNLTIAEGRNRGKEMNYVHIISAMHDLGPVEANTRELVLDPHMTAAHKGFMLLLQNERSGAIIAAANYETPSK